MRVPLGLDPAGALQWATRDDLTALLEREPWRSAWAMVERPQVVLLAALLSSAFDGSSVEIATDIAPRIGLNEEDSSLLTFLVQERHLLPQLPTDIPSARRRPCSSWPRTSGPFPAAPACTFRP